MISFFGYPTFEAFKAARLATAHTPHLRKLFDQTYEQHVAEVVKRVSKPNFFESIIEFVETEWFKQPFAFHGQSVGWYFHHPETRKLVPVDFSHATMPSADLCGPSLADRFHRGTQTFSYLSRRMTIEALRTADPEFARLDGPFRREHLFAQIRVGDRVTIETPHGSFRTGTARIIGKATVALNGGGAHGTPVIATQTNTVSIRRGGTRKALRIFVQAP